MLLLLNLHVTIDKGSLNFECGRIMAQVWLEETLPEVVVIGSQYTTCTACYMTVEKRNLQMHLEQDCPKRTVECAFCGQTYVFCNGHSCTGTCALCHKPANECTCDGCTCNGSNNSGNSSGNSENTGNGTGSSGSSSSGGTGQSNGSDYLSGPIGSKKNNVSKRKLKEGVIKYGYTVDYTKANSGCLRGWKLVWQYAGIGEYDATRSAKDFGPVLLKYGFKVIYEGNGEHRPSGYTPQIGDTRVWDTYPDQKAGPHGHIDWYDGKNWISDYTQPGNGFWAPGKNYRKHNTSYKIYR